MTIFMSKTVVEAKAQLCEIVNQASKGKSDYQSA
jgi:hypothetical protein